VWLAQARPSRNAGMLARVQPQAGMPAVLRANKEKTRSAVLPAPRRFRGGVNETQMRPRVRHRPHPHPARLALRNPVPRCYLKGCPLTTHDPDAPLDLPEAGPSRPGFIHSRSNGLLTDTPGLLSTCV